MSENSAIDPPDEPGADVSHRTLFTLERLDSYAHVVVAVFFLILSSAVLIASVVIFCQSVGKSLHGGEEATQHFVHDSLEVLSTLLFAVIILELLRTIITYLQTRDTQAIMKEFLIVGIISSVRKILMVGAESSIVKPEGSPSSASVFVQESTGVVISVAAILLMIGGLILLKRYYAPHVREE